MEPIPKGVKWADISDDEDDPRVAQQNTGDPPAVMIDKNGIKVAYLPPHLRKRVKSKTTSISKK
jgi:hypothetical protein